MYITYCKLCPSSSIITKNVLDVCKLLQVMSFSPNSVKFLWLNMTRWTPHEGILVIYSHVGSILSYLTTKYPHVGSIFVRFNHTKFTELALKDITCKGLQTSSTFSVIIEDKGHSLQ
ncbi:hypothetical protein Hanom_Chr16g01523081 [Helianthus anomalus]